jgi:glycosyltransferase involved in cell wall biosynthesis
MRIAVVNWSSRRVGGTETYLSNIVPELARLGHEVAFWCETDRPEGRERITLPEGTPVWCASELGARRALAALREWRPDLIYSHGIHTPGLEIKTLRVAPAVFFAHTYHGTCISGAKTFKRPVVKPCDRRFGPKCLLHYYPNRCGGLSPLTMLRLFRTQSKRLEVVKEYEAVITHSSHMHAEYLKHGLRPERVFNLSYYAHSAFNLAEANLSTPLLSNERGPGAEAERTRYELLFLGRMDYLKGGRTLIAALPRIVSELGRPVRVTFAGDGPDRAGWERKAAEARKKGARFECEFVGWVPRARLDDLLGECDLLVFPSLWPEPFGLAGPEAGLRGVPVAAFDVGGISDWLKDGINGHLAPGDPPTAEGLARAVVECLRDPSAHAQLRRGALEVARRFNLKTHITALLEIFGQIVAEGRQGGAAGVSSSAYVQRPVGSEP